MPNIQLLNFIKSQYDLNIPKAELKNKLLAVGWPEKVIDETVAYIDVPLPNQTDAVPTPTGTGQNTMFYAFQHVIMFLTMAIYTFSLNSLLHAFIDKYVSKPITNSNNYSDVFSYLTESDVYIRGLVSAIMVSHPIFMFLFLRTTKLRIIHPELKYLQSRAVLTYITLVITFLVMLFNVIKVIFTVLEGNFNLSVFLHFLTPLTICGVIFWYFLREILERKHRV